MSLCAKRMWTLAYAVIALAVGMWRHFETGDSMQAVWYGAFVGLVACAGSFVALSSGWRKWAGLALIGVSLVFEVGWFGRRIFVHEEGASLRVIVALVACVMLVVVWVAPASKRVGSACFQAGVASRPFLGYTTRAPVGTVAWQHPVGTGRYLGQEIFHHMTVNVGQAEVAAREAVGEFLVLDAEEV